MGEVFRGESAAAAWALGRATRDSSLAAATGLLLELAGVRPGARVLDVGCGDGGQSAAAIGLGASVVATDLSADMLRLAGIPAAAAMDAQALAVRSGAFDAAISRNCVMLVPSPRRALREISRAVRPGGRLAVSVWAEGKRTPRLGLPLEVGRSLGIDVTPDFALARACGLGAPGVLSALLAEAGLEEVRAEEVDATLTHAGVEEYLAVMRPHPGVRQIVAAAPQLEERFWAALRERVGRYAEGGLLRIPAVSVVGAGRVP